jgi:hypothetical protein
VRADRLAELRDLRKGSRSMRIWPRHAEPRRAAAEKQQRSGGASHKARPIQQSPARKFPAL